MLRSCSSRCCLFKYWWCLAITMLSLVSRSIWKKKCVPCGHATRIDHQCNLMLYLIVMYMFQREIRSLISVIIFTLINNFKIVVLSQSHMFCQQCPQGFSFCRQQAKMALSYNATASLALSRDKRNYKAITEVFILDICPLRKCN